MTAHIALVLSPSDNRLEHYAIPGEPYGDRLLRHHGTWRHPAGKLFRATCSTLDNSVLQHGFREVEMVREEEAPPAAVPGGVVGGIPGGIPAVR